MTKRTYANGEIEVFWDSTRCVHVGWCSGSMPAVFDTQKRPWVDLEGAAPDEVAAVVSACPSGALTYHRLDGGPQEQPESPPSIVPWPNGPLFVRGEVALRDNHGDTYETALRSALCRCGQSKNHPFCDLSHRKAGFESRPRAIPQDRHDAESPKEVGPHFET
jgi:uncharacterized Fe-S cluster protein YjdI/CDGSH-type Zn-finger protein